MKYFSVSCSKVELNLGEFNQGIGFPPTTAGTVIKVGRLIQTDKAGTEHLTSEDSVVGMQLNSC